jgi:septum formation protein
MRSIVPDFDILAPDIDEKAIRHHNPQVLTSEIAIAKSRALQRFVYEPAILITADTVVTWNGIIREKPENDHQARLFLSSYREAPACVVTSVFGWNSGTWYEDLVVDEARVYFKGLTDRAIERLIASGVPLSGAGGFAVGHDVFKDHIDHVSGSFSSAMGLPRRLTATMIESLGTEV